jgi:hypothetical protein
MWSRRAICWVWRYGNSLYSCWRSRKRVFDLGNVWRDRISKRRERVRGSHSVWIIRRNNTRKTNRKRGEPHKRNHRGNARGCKKRNATAYCRMLSLKMFDVFAHLDCSILHPYHAPYTLNTTTSASLPSRSFFFSVSLSSVLVFSAPASFRNDLSASLAPISP